MTDYSQATLEDVPQIVDKIVSLRRLTFESGMITTRTQSEILRVLPTPVLMAVATELNRPLSPGLVAALSGQADQPEGR